MQMALVSPPVLALDQSRRRQSKIRNSNNTTAIAASTQAANAAALRRQEHLSEPQEAHHQLRRSSSDKCVLDLHHASSEPATASANAPHSPTSPTSPVLRPTIVFPFESNSSSAARRRSASPHIFAASRPYTAPAVPNMQSARTHTTAAARRHPGDCVHARRPASLPATYLKDAVDRAQASNHYDTPPQTPSPSSPVEDEPQEVASQHNHKKHAAQQQQKPRIDAGRKPCKPRVRKSLRWADECGSQLCRRQLFHKRDEPWRCSAQPEAPPTYHTLEDNNIACVDDCMLFDPLNLPRSDSAMGAVLAGAHVQLEAVRLLLPCVHLTIRVTDECFEKRVVVRYTTDNWNSFEDLEATHLPGAPEGTTRFGASLRLDNYRLIKNIEFCICYTTQSGAKFWDNNGGANYIVRRMSTHAPLDPSDNCAPSPPRSLSGNCSFYM